MRPPLHVAVMTNRNVVTFDVTIREVVPEVDQGMSAQEQPPGYADAQSYYKGKLTDELKENKLNQERVQLELRQLEIEAGLKLLEE